MLERLIWANSPKRTAVVANATLLRSEGRTFNRSDLGSAETSETNGARESTEAERTAKRSGARESTEAERTAKRSGSAETVKLESTFTDTERRKRALLQTERRKRALLQTETQRALRSGERTIENTTSTNVSNVTNTTNELSTSWMMGNTERKRARTLHLNGSSSAESSSRDGTFL
jgi:hypothetical protein